MNKKRDYRSAGSLTTLVRAAFGEDAAGRLVRSDTDRRGSYRPLKGGYFADVYRIILRDGRRVILKLAPESEEGFLRYEKNMLKRETEMMRVIRERSTVPVPEVYSFDDSRTLIPTAYYFMEEIPGVCGGLTEENYEETGRIARHLAMIDNAYFGFPDAQETQSTSWAETLRRIFELLCADMEISPSAERFRGIVAGVRERMNSPRVQSALEEVKVPGLVHNDLWEGNFMTDHGKITGVIDFGRSVWGDPLMEEWFFAGNEKFMRGYGKTSFTKNERLRMALYALLFNMERTSNCGELREEQIEEIHTLLEKIQQ